MGLFRLQRYYVVCKMISFFTYLEEQTVMNTLGISALVTGGASGLGLASAKRLIAQGAKTDSTCTT